MNVWQTYYATLVGGLDESQCKSKAENTKHGGVCLEMQRHANGVNLPEMPQSAVLRPGEVYRQKTVYKFTTTNESEETAAEGASTMPDLSELTREEIEDYLEQLFKIGDINSDGVLSPEEFTNVLSKSGFKFEQSVIDKMVAAADVNGDGVIDFGEFVPAMMKLGESMQEELFSNKGKVATQVEAGQQQTKPCKYRVRSKHYLN